MPNKKKGMAKKGEGRGNLVKTAWRLFWGSGGRKGRKALGVSGIIFFSRKVHFVFLPVFYYNN